MEKIWTVVNGDVVLAKTCKHYSNPTLETIRDRLVDIGCKREQAVRDFRVDFICSDFRAKWRLTWEITGGMNYFTYDEIDYLYQTLREAKLLHF